MAVRFDHERLKVFQCATAFAGWCEMLVEHGSRKTAVTDQLERASSSIALNIAEGNGKSSNRERCRFLEIARGSALECAACLDLMVAKNRLTAEAIQPDKQQLREVVAMLFGLIQRVEPGRTEKR